MTNPPEVAAIETWARTQYEMQHRLAKENSHLRKEHIALSSAYLELANLIASGEWRKHMEPDAEPGLYSRFHTMLLDLLAVIHRDGGHKTQEIGIELAWKQAMQMSSERVAAVLAHQPDPQPDNRLLPVFLYATVSEDTSEIGIDHPTEADWQAVLQAHVALRDRLNERIAEQDRCPIKPNPQPTEAADDEVLQCDRDAAAALMQAMPLGGMVGSAEVSEGGNDRHYFVQAFAAHRRAAIAALRPTPDADR